MDLTASSPAAAELRRNAEALIAHLAAGGATPFLPPAVTDIEGYWLPPALQALLAIMAGDEALEPLTRAAQRDEQRTALFLCLGLAVAGQGDRIHASWLGIAFGDLSADHPVTHGQRALWRAAARGAYGPAGKIFVLRKLDNVVIPEGTDTDRWLGALVPTEPAAVVPPALADFPELARFPALARPARAAARLARLHARCVEITSSRRPGDGESPTFRNGAQRPASAWPHDEPLAVLRMLIGSAVPEPPMGSLIGHLLDDLGPGADPDLAASALHVAGPVIRAVAEELAEATAFDPPQSISVAILGHSVVLHPEGPDAASLAAARERIAAQAVPVRPTPWRAYAALTVGTILIFLTAALAVTGVSAAPLACATGLALCGAGWWLLRRGRLQRDRDARLVAARVAELGEQAERAVWALHEYAREAQDRAKSAADDLAELTRLIRRGPRAR